MAVFGRTTTGLTSADGRADEVGDDEDGVGVEGFSDELPFFNPSPRPTPRPTPSTMMIARPINATSHFRCRPQVLLGAWSTPETCFSLGLGTAYHELLVKHRSTSKTHGLLSCPENKTRSDSQDL